MRSVLLFTGVALATLSASAPASAATYLFQLSGSRDAQFAIDTAVTPDYESSSFIGNQISYNSVNGSFGNIAGSASISFGTFLIATLNILGTPQGFTQFAGPDLFSLVNNVPVFNTGTFNLTSIGSGNSTLQISAGPAGTSAVPEPATWAMFIGGFGLMGAALRSRRTAVRYV